MQSALCAILERSVVEMQTVPRFFSVSFFFLVEWTIVFLALLGVPSLFLCVFLQAYISVLNCKSLSETDVSNGQRAEKCASEKMDIVLALFMPVPPRSVLDDVYTWQKC